MGNYFSSQDVRPNLQQLVEQLEQTRMERDIAFAQMQEHRRLAYKLAEEREKLNWSSCGGALVVVLSTLSAFQQKNLLHLLPVFPTVAYLGHKTHLCYGDKLVRLQDATRAILEESAEKWTLLPPSPNDVRRKAAQMRQISGDDEAFEPKEISYFALDDSGRLFNKLLSFCTLEYLEIHGPVKHEALIRGRSTSEAKRRAVPQQMELRLASSYLLKVQKEALELAKLRDRFSFELLASVSTIAVLFIAGSIYKRKDFVVPMVPLIMATGYRYDSAFGDIQEINLAAEEILRTSPHLAKIVGEPITLRDVDNYRRSHFAK